MKTKANRVRVGGHYPEAIQTMSGLIINTNVQLQLESDAISKAWRFGEFRILAESRVREFYTDTGVKDTEAQDSCLNVFNLVCDIGWLRHDSFGILWLYNEKVAQEAMERIQGMDGGQFCVKPVPVETFMVDQLIFHVPSRLKKHLASMPNREVKRSYALHVLSHELAHAFGVGPGSSDGGLDEATLDLLADCVSFQANFSPVLPELRITYLFEHCRRDLGKHPTREEMYEYARRTIDQMKRPMPTAVSVSDRVTDSRLVQLKKERRYGR